MANVKAAMLLQAHECTAANCAGDAPRQIQAQFDLPMDAAPAVCSQFVGRRRADGNWGFVPAARHGTCTARNLLAVRANRQSLRRRIIQDEPVQSRFERVAPEHLGTYCQRLAARHQCLSAL